MSTREGGLRCIVHVATLRVMSQRVPVHGVACSSVYPIQMDVLLCHTQQLRHHLSIASRQEASLQTMEHRHPPQQLQQHEQKLSSPLRTQRSVAGQQKDEPSQGNVRPSSTGRLRAGRYRLGEKLEVLLWGTGCWKPGGTAMTSAEAEHALCSVTCNYTGLTSRDSLLANLDTTARTLAAIGRHHSVPTLVDTCSENGHVFFAFDAVEGECHSLACVAANKHYRSKRSSRLFAYYGRNGSLFSAIASGSAWSH